MADEWSSPPICSKQGKSSGKNREDLGSPEKQVAEDFSVERICTAVKVKIVKLEDEEKEKMSFYPKGNSNLIHYLCKHDLANLAAEQGWKLILEKMDQKLLPKLLIKKEVPIENCRDKVRELIVKALPNLHQEKCDLSSLSNKEPSDRELDNKGPLQQALACLVPSIKAGQNQADVLYDKDLNCLIITGPKETVKQLHMEAKVKLYSVTMETVLESPSHGCLLRTFRVIDKLRGQYPGLTVVVQDCNTKVTWTGTEENIRGGRQEMEKFFREIKAKTFHVSKVMKKLLLTPEVKHYIDNVLQRDGITCVWQVTETGQVQVWSMQASSSKHVVLKIRENFQENAFLVKDFPFILKLSKEGFGLGTAEMNHFSVEETSDTVHVAAKSGTMQKIIQYLQDLEDQPTPGKQPSVNQATPDVAEIPKPVESPNAIPLNENHPQVVFDLETTGLGRYSHITQIAAVGPNGNFSRFVLPKIDIETKASEVTGIKMMNGDMYFKEQKVIPITIKQALQEFRSYLGETPAMLVGHNIKVFDCHVLLNAANACGITLDSSIAGFMDTLPMFRKTYPGLASYSQGSLYHHFFEESYNAHDSIEDAVSLQRLLFEKSPKNILPYTFTLQFVRDTQKHSKNTKHNLLSWNPLIRQQIISKSMAKKAAASGLQLCHVQLAFTRQETDGVKSLFSKNTRSGKARVTKSKKIITKLVEYFKSHDDI